MSDLDNFAERFRVLIDVGNYDEALNTLEIYEEETLYLLWNHPDLPRDIKTTGRPLAQQIDETTWHKLAERLHKRYRWSRLLIYPSLSLIGFIAMLYIAFSSFANSEIFNGSIFLIASIFSLFLGIFVLRLVWQVRQGMRSATKKK